MWCVMQVHTGMEEKIRCQCEKLIDDSVLKRCFIPQFQTRKKYLGQWHTENKILFPGYVFLVTDYPEALIEGLRRVVGMTRVLKTGEEITPLSDGEVALLLKMGGEKQEVEMSTGIIEGDLVHVYTGPLQGMEGMIKKIDRHKRMAYLEIEMFGRKVEMQAGLEIIKKIDS